GWWARRRTQEGLHAVGQRRGYYCVAFGGQVTVVRVERVRVARRDALQVQEPEAFRSQRGELGRELRAELPPGDRAEVTMLGEGDPLDLELLRRQVGAALGDDLGLEHVEDGDAPRFGDRPEVGH